MLENYYIESFEVIITPLSDQLFIKSDFFDFCIIWSVLLKVSRWPHFTQNLRCWYSIPASPANQQLQEAGFFSMFKFNVKHVASSSSFCLKIWPKVRSFLHTFCWLIKSSVFCIFHFIPRMFCSFTQHCCCLYIFPLSALRSCWSEYLGSACFTTTSKEEVITMYVYVIFVIFYGRRKHRLL